MKKFYAVEYLSGRNTTTGEPNARTRCMNIATDTVAFDSKSERISWVNDGKNTSAMRGNCRASVSLRQLRRLNLGLSLDEFNQRVEEIQYAS